MFKLEGAVTNVADKKPGASCMGCTAPFTTQRGAGVHPHNKEGATQKAPTSFEKSRRWTPPSRWRALHRMVGVLTASVFLRLVSVRRSCLLLLWASRQRRP